MITLTKLDQSKVLINLDSVKYIESTPDSLIRFLNGDSVIVKENFDEIEKLSIHFKQKCLNQLSESTPSQNLPI